MKILLKKTRIADPGSPYNGLVKDILIDNGTFTGINDEMAQGDDVQVIENATISPGWVDTFSLSGDPGNEYKETLETLSAAAAAGGYTHAFMLPNTNPVVQNKSQVEYIVQRSKSLPIHIYPLGAVTKNCEGKELAEMYDMQSNGAIAFTDGLNPVQSAGILIKALEYVKAFNGTVIQVANDKSIGKFGLINEGIISTRLGLPGIPAIAEEIMIERDIKLAEYTNSKLHFTAITTERSVQLIQKAKDNGLQITCAVTPYHLFYCDEDMQQYDTNLKVDPPLRTRKDMMALRKATLNGVIDCISSHHLPQDWDSKTCEFEYAKCGMIGLQTSYAAANTALSNLDPEKIAALFSLKARNIFGLPHATIKEGNPADITIYDPMQNFSLTKANNKSRSSNSPFFDQVLSGKVIGIYTAGKLTLNK